MLKGNLQRNYFEVCITGLIRHCDYKQIRQFRSITNALNTSKLHGNFWRYPFAQNIPTSNSKVKNKILSESEWGLIIDSFPGEINFRDGQNDKVSQTWEHLLEKELNLKPNLSATKSWLSSIQSASQLLTKQHTNAGKIWMIARPDIYTLKFTYFKLSKYIDKNPIKPNEILVAKRPYDHNVLDLNGRKQNLPIDHFFIGSAESINVFDGIVDYLNLCIKGIDKRQPLVNEFLIGQYLDDQKISIRQIDFPYFIRRDSWTSTLLPNGQNVVEKIRAAVLNLKFQLIQFFRLLR